MRSRKKRQWSGDTMRLTEIEYHVFRKKRETHALVRDLYDPKTECLQIEIAPWSDLNDTIVYRLEAVTSYEVFREEERAQRPFDIIGIRSRAIENETQGRHRFEFDCFETAFSFNATWPAPSTWVEPSLTEPSSTEPSLTVEEKESATPETTAPTENTTPPTAKPEQPSV